MTFTFTAVSDILFTVDIPIFYFIADKPQTLNNVWRGILLVLLCDTCCTFDHYFKVRIIQHKFNSYLAHLCFTYLVIYHHSAIHPPNSTSFSSSPTSTPATPSSVPSSSSPSGGDPETARMVTMPPKCYSGFTSWSVSEVLSLRSVELISLQ